MDLWIYLIIALIIVFAIILWNAYNSPTYKSLRKARNIWDDSSTDFKARVKAGVEDELQHASNRVGRAWDQITDALDGKDGYDSDEGGYDGDYGGYT